MLSSSFFRCLTTKSVRSLPNTVSGLSGRYVQAIYSASIEKNQSNKVCSESANMLSLLERNKKLKEVLLSPLVDRVQKLELVEQISKELNMSPIMTQSIKLIMTNKREKLLHRILSELDSIRGILSGEVNCVVTVANPITTAQQNDLLNTIKSFIKHDQHLKAQFKIVPSIIGGCKIEIGDKYVDLSFASQLEEYRKALEDQ
ncbi:hypothetical protein GJ496_003376 [Pomphorhynchus laevis]|nr:hypothetical protein GJ496_003376 [Pomphorhynchus laevis]